MTDKYKSILLNVLSLFFVAGGILLAGSITAPSGAPAVSGYTLSDVYGKLTNPSYTLTPSHGLAPSAPVGVASMYSLDNIYNAVPAHEVMNNSTTTLAAGIYNTTTLTSIEPNLSADNIASGTEIFGITGTFVCNP